MKTKAIGTSNTPAYKELNPLSHSPMKQEMEAKTDITCHSLLQYHFVQ